MIVYPPAKINLGLHIIRRRDDGFHDLQTVFFPVPLFDILEINLSDHDHFKVTGMYPPGEVQDNLVMKAVSRLKERIPGLPFFNIHLHKQIPAGGGLGGGSSDAAHTLMAIDRLCSLALPVKTLQSIAASLGSDCPFFLHQGPCSGEGRGEILFPQKVPFEGYFLVLAFPPVHVSTAWAYTQVKPADDRKSPAEIIVSLSPEKWKGRLFNDLEGPVKREYPDIAAVKELLYAQGADFAMMSGSGSTVFAIFSKRPDLSLNVPFRLFRL